MKMKLFFSVIVLFLFLPVQAWIQTANYYSPPSIIALKRGFRSTIDIGLGMNPNSSSKYGSGSSYFSYQGGFQFAKGVFTGLEFGYQNYRKTSIYHKFPDHLFLFGFPIEYIIRKKKTSPYISAYMGVSYDLNEKLKPTGNVFRLIGGFRTPISDCLAIRYGLGYELHSFSIVEHDPSIEWTGEANRKRNNIRIHVDFQF